MKASWIAAVNAFLFNIFYGVLLLQYIQAPAVRLPESFRGRLSTFPYT